MEIIINQLLERAGIHASMESLTPFSNGGNNRTFHLQTTNGDFVVKQYCRQAQDKRDRLASEYAFLTYANKVASGMVPKAYAMDADNSVALYEYIHGKPIEPEQVAEEDVAAAAAFFCALNQSKLKSEAIELPLASEACFSIVEHMALIDARIDALKALEPKHTEDKLAAQLTHRMMNAWDILKKQAHEFSAACSIDMQKQLDYTQYCISPSDFGFHNALKEPDGRIRFLDFEYAGWDDPAKMVGDFFSQLAVPVPLMYFERFNKVVMKSFPDTASLILRAVLLRPIYQIKWCCIALNIFIPSNLERRVFANPELNIVKLKQAQLHKAEAILQKMEVL